MILPIATLIISLTLGVGLIIFLKKSEQNKRAYINEEIDEREETANDFVNVKDIRGNILITNDDMAMVYLKISPISIDLYSNNEKNLITKQLTANLSSFQYPFKFTAVSRPVNIEPLIVELSNLISTSDDSVQKAILRKEITEVSNFAMDGEVIERQFYCIISQSYDEYAENEILKKANEFSSLFTDVGISCGLLNSNEIVRLCNLINNPSYIHLENTDFESGATTLSNFSTEELKNV